MPRRITLNHNQRISLDAPVERIEVHIGSLRVMRGEEETLVATGDTYIAGGRAGLSLYAPDSASVLVTTSDEVRV